jgi:CRISPR-associated protein Cmr2
MSDQERWLISLSIGPVQDFIAAALRTRDLWFGSHMLSEVSKAAARAIMEQKGELIFPAVENSDDLKRDLPLNVANRIVAEVRGDNKSVEEIINAGKTAAQKRLQEFIEQAKEKAEGKGVHLRDDIWNRQIDPSSADPSALPEDLLELYGTAARITKQGNDGYKDAKNRLDQISTARKNSRNFIQSAAKPDEKPFYGLPKSSLDGRRETVLQKVEDKEKDKLVRRRLRMGDGEQLDVMGLVKRLAGEDPDQFTPTTRIAVDPWIRKIKKLEKGQSESTIQNIYNELKANEDNLMNFSLMTKVGGNKKIYQDIPFDAGLLYQGVLDEAIRKNRDEKKIEEENLLKRLRKDVMQGAWKEYGQPCPYYAMLLADGDYMGALIKAARNDEQHREISKRLSRFAQGVPDTAREHQAHCIYAGGDDVLLMAPLDTVLDLAEELRKKFKSKLKGIAEKLRQQQPDLQLKDPTFSVGIVIAHMQTPMGLVRRLAAEAEKIAKNGFKETDKSRNALAIIVAPRSGAECRFRAQWDKNPVKNLNKLAALYRNEDLPTGFGYELRQIELLTKGMKDQAKAEEIKELELERILQRKNQGGGQEKVIPETKDAVLKHAKGKTLKEVCQEHLIARWLGAHGEERG